jgi:hypothetical protein
LTLDRLDHFIKESLRVPGYVRYMDDFVLFAASKQQLKYYKAEVEDFLSQRLDLRLKPQASLLGPATQGLPFLGWQVHRHIRRLRRDNARRSLRRLRHRRWEYARGYCDEAALADSARSIIAHLEQGQTLGLRRAWLEAMGGRGCAP